MVFNRNLYKCVYEKDFNDTVHSGLCNLESRHSCETAAAAFLTDATASEWTPMDVVIDIAEPISFEVDLKVATETGYKLFRDTGSSFSPEIVAKFTQSLRKFRIFVPAPKIGKIHGPLLDAMVKEMLLSEKQPENFS